MARAKEAESTGEASAASGGASRQRLGRVLVGWWATWGGSVARPRARRSTCGWTGARGRLWATPYCWARLGRGGWFARRATKRSRRSIAEEQPGAVGTAGGRGKGLAYGRARGVGVWDSHEAVQSRREAVEACARRLAAGHDVSLLPAYPRRCHAHSCAGSGGVGHASGGGSGEGGEAEEAASSWSRGRWMLGVGGS